MNHVAEVRSFNRFYTAQIGALSDAYLDTPYGLTEARVLFELARGESAEPSAVASNLGLDPSYLSRILARFERDGLLERHRATYDARRRVLQLTENGRSEAANLDERSSASVRQLLNQVSEADRVQLVEAMRTIRSLLHQAGVIDAGDGPTGANDDAPSEEDAASDEHAERSRLTLREPLPGELGWVVQRNGALYAAEYGWDQTYEGLVARILGDFGNGHDAETERGWIATLDDRPVGFVMCVRADSPGTERPTVAKLRLLFVEPEARGHGVGSALVEECIRFARAVGYAKLTLWTNDPLTAARRIYDRAGFRLVSENRHTSFGHTMTGQVMELRL